MHVGWRVTLNQIIHLLSFLFFETSLCYVSRRLVLFYWKLFMSKKKKLSERKIQRRVINSF